jgi:hypothetical protein
VAADSAKLDPPLQQLAQGGMMSITAHSTTAGGTGAKARLPMLSPPFAALL